MKVNPWVIPGSLQNLPPVKGLIPGFHFVYRARTETFLYVTYRMTLLVDGMDASSNLRVRWRGQTMHASDLAETDWVCRAGQPIEVIADFPGGLKPGRHHVKLEVRSGGFPTGDCEFEDEVA